MKKILIILFSIIFAVGLVYFSQNLFQIKTTRAMIRTIIGWPSENSWAWSDTIGWISFNCADTKAETRKDCVTTVTDPTTQIGDYVVYIKDDGTLGGYAWSENIGWISFNESDLTGCPSEPCLVKISDVNKLGKSNVNIVGWARACAGTVSGDCSGSSRTDGWDGWIKFDHGKGNEPYIDSNGNWHGYAWGSDVVGWIKFNCDTDPNECAISDYKVKTPFDSSQRPYIEPNSAKISGKSYCNIGPGVGRISFEWTYKDNNGDSQSYYHLQVATDSGFNNKVVDREISQSVSPGAKGTSAVLIVPNPNTYSRCISGGDFEGRCVAYGKTYYWRIRVAATGNQDWSDWETGSPSSFDTPSHAYPWPDFSHSPKNPSIGEIVNFTDKSKCYSSPNNTEYNCKDGDDSIKYAWDFDYSESKGFTGDSYQKGDATTTYSQAKTYQVRLKITDSNLSPPGICIGSGDSPVGLTFPLPKWREIPPF